MTFRSTLPSSGWQRLALACLAIALLGLLTTASAQYGTSPYPYSRPPAPSRQLPNTARNLGGFTGNPYRASQVAPSGLPVSGNLQSYYGGGGRGSSLGYRSPTKPFTNLHRPQPLISSREVARIEVARGLWRPY